MQRYFIPIWNTKLRIIVNVNFDLEIFLFLKTMRFTTNSLVTDFVVTASESLNTGVTLALVTFVVPMETSGSAGLSGLLRRHENQDVTPPVFFFSFFGMCSFIRFWLVFCNNSKTAVCILNSYLCLASFLYKCEIAFHILNSYQWLIF